MLDLCQEAQAPSSTVWENLSLPANTLSVGPPPTPHPRPAFLHLCEDEQGMSAQGRALCRA